MPNSRRRKKQVIALRRQLEKNRRKVNHKDLEDQENKATADREIGKREQSAGSTQDSELHKSWWDWCTSGVTQVRIIGTLKVIFALSCLCVIRRVLKLPRMLCFLLEHCVGS